MVKMPNNDGESEESEIDASSSSEFESDSSEMTENETRIGRKIADCSEILGKHSTISTYHHPVCINSLFFQHPVDLERQFGILREQLYKERINQVETQLQEIDSGRSQEYLGPLQALADRMNNRKEVAEYLKKCRLDNIRNKFDSEEQAALQDYLVGYLYCYHCNNELIVSFVFRVKK